MGQVKLDSYSAEQPEDGEVSILQHKRPPRGWKVKNDMREIKFREYNATQEFMAVVDTLDLESWNDPEERPSNIVLMQYTGLKDKNGVEIYEGDVIGYTGFDGKRHHARVFWKDDECRFFAKINGMEARFTLSATTPQGTDTDLQVIGNIYENPELAEGR